MTLCSMLVTLLPELVVDELGPVRSGPILSEPGRRRESNDVIGDPMTFQAAEVRHFRISKLSKKFNLVEKRQYPWRFPFDAMGCVH